MRLLPVTDKVWERYQQSKDVEVRDLKYPWDRIQTGDHLKLCRRYNRNHDGIEVEVGQIWKAKLCPALPDAVLQRAHLMTTGDGRSAGTFTGLMTFNGPVIAFEVKPVG